MKELSISKRSKVIDIIINQNNFVNLLAMLSPADAFNKGAFIKNATRCPKTGLFEIFLTEFFMKFLFGHTPLILRNINISTF